MRLTLGVLMGWCREWSVEVNGEKCEAMHMRRKGIKSKEEKFYVGEEEIATAEECKYFGCVVDEHGQCRRMVEERVMNEIKEGWQEMEGKDKVVCVVDKACKNGRVWREVERLYRKQLD